MKYVTLNTGTKMPMLGYGVFKIDDNQAGDAVKTAIAAGYRSIDTAAIYGNEKAVGQAIKESDVPREEIFLTTKLWNENMRIGNYEDAFEESLNNLDVDYVDLYLIHWPVKDKYVDSWLAMEKIFKSGRAKAIGVSNFMPHHIDDVIKAGTIVPALNQYEMHPYLARKEVLTHCKKLGITPQSWGPLGGSNPENKDLLLDNPVLKKIADKYAKSTAQVILRWNIDIGVVCIPKSVTPSRIKANFDVFDFELTPDEVATIDGLNKDTRFGANPDNFDF